MKIAVILLGKLFSEATTGDALSKKGVLKNFAKFTRKYLCQGLFFNNVNFIKKETLAQLLSCKFCEISKNTCFTEHLWTTASALFTLEI